jgi:hypothetical protein
MALNPSGAISLAGPSAGQSIAVELGVSATATISLNDTNVRTLAGVASGVIVMPTDFWGKSNSISTQKAIFAFGNVLNSPNESYVSMTNLISSAGVVASDTPTVAQARQGACGVGYGGDKGIFSGGANGNGGLTTSFVYNYVSNTGVISSDNSSSGTARTFSMGAIYGSDKGVVFGGAPGGNPAGSSQLNYLSNTGVFSGSSLTPTAGTRGAGFGLSYGGNNDKGIIGMGASGPAGLTAATQQLVSNTGVISATTPIVGATSRRNVTGAAYGGDKGIVAFGSTATSPYATNISNLISNTAVIASDTPGVGTARFRLSAAGYGNDKAIFGYGYNFAASTPVSLSNLISNTGVVASDTPGVGTARNSAGGVGYSLTA